MSNSQPPAGRDDSPELDLATRGRSFVLVEAWTPPLTLVAAGGLATAAFVTTAIETAFPVVLIAFYLLLAAAFALVTLPAAAGGLEVLATAYRLPTIPSLRLRLAAVFACPAAGVVIGYSQQPGVVQPLLGLLAGLVIAAGVFWLLFPFRPSRIAAAFGMSGLWWLVAFSLSTLVLSGLCLATTLAFSTRLESTWVAAEPPPEDAATAAVPADAPADTQPGDAPVPVVGPVVADAVEQAQQSMEVAAGIAENIVAGDQPADTPADTPPADVVEATPPADPRLASPAGGQESEEVVTAVEAAPSDLPAAKAVPFDPQVVASAVPLSVEGTLLPSRLLAAPWAARVVEAQGTYEVFAVDLTNPNPEQAAEAEDPPSVIFANVLGGVNGFAVSPDGQLVAAVVQGLRRELEVRRFSDGSLAHEFELPGDVDLEIAGFIPDARGRGRGNFAVVLRSTQAGQTALRHFFLADNATFAFSAALASSYPGPVFADDGERAFLLVDNFNGEMGIAYHAAYERRYDQRNAKSLGIDPTIGATFAGLAVSPQRDVVAALVRVGQLAFIIPVEARGLNKRREVQLPAQVVPPTTPFEAGNLLWLPEPGTWLLYGRTLVDPATGQPTGDVGLPPTGRPHHLGGRTLLYEPATPADNWLLVELK